jgi:hypothetical protein
MGECEVCGRPAERHHIVFKSQGGLDFELNFKDLCFEHHKGNKSPHCCRKIDLKYKVELERKLEKLLDKEFYTEDEIRQLLGLKKKQADKIFRRFRIYPEGYSRDEILRRLMGGRLYG